MTVSIHQPSYFPWLGLLDKIKKSDSFILLDNVQLSDSAYQNRNIFLNNNNEKHILTIPINKKNYFKKTIKDIETSNNFWQKKHSKFIFFNYKKHPYFDEIYPLIKPIYEKDYKYLIEILYDSMEISFEIFDLKKNIILASEIDKNNHLKKDKLIIDILKKTNAKKYLSGTGARNYQKDELFEQEGFGIEYQHFTHPVYSQHNNIDFIDGLSSLDAAFNLGLDNSKLII